MPAPSRAYDRVPVAPLRQAFLESGMTRTELAHAMGKDSNYTSSLGRSLGLAPHWNGAQRRCVGYSRRIGYDLALRVVEGLNLDPVDFGL